MSAETVAPVECRHHSLFTPVVALRLGISVDSVSSDLHPTTAIPFSPNCEATTQDLSKQDSIAITDSG